MSKPSRRGIPIAPWVVLGMTEEEYNAERNSGEVKPKVPEDTYVPPKSGLSDGPPPTTSIKTSALKTVKGSNSIIEGVDNTILLGGGILVLFLLFK